MHQLQLIWNTDSPVESESRWKARFAPCLPDAPWPCLMIHQGNSALTVSARSADATRWLQSNVALLSRVVMQRLGVITMKMREVDPSLRHGQGRMFSYTLPMVLVSDTKPTWDWYNQDAVAAEAARALMTRFQADIVRQLLQFQECDQRAQALRARGERLDLQLLDPGRPMPVRLALPDHKAGTHRMRWFLGRKGLVFQSPWRIEGDFAVGKLQGLGFGRLYRTDVLNAVDAASGSAA